MAFAMGIGGMLFAVLALLGVHVVLSTIPLLYVILKVLGGAYLIYLGCSIWRNAARPIDLQKVGVTSKRSFWLGLATQLSGSPSVSAWRAARCFPITSGKRLCRHGVRSGS